MAFATATSLRISVSDERAAGEHGFTMISITSVFKTSGIQDTFCRFMSFLPFAPCNRREELTQLTVIHEKRAETSDELADSDDKLQSAEPSSEKSSVGDVVKNVEKKWVKIVEIVVPIAVGLPLLIIIGICCFVGCAGRKFRRQNKV